MHALRIAALLPLLLLLAPSARADMYPDGSNATNPVKFPAALELGKAGVLGSLTMGNATSGTIKLQPVTGALGTATLSLPAATDTLVGKATTDTLTSKTLSGAILSGATTLPGSGQISGTGDLGLGITPTARLQIGGTWTSAQPSVVVIAPTHASSFTTTQRSMYLATSFAPSGGSLSGIEGLNVLSTLISNSLTITNYLGVSSGMTLGASFTGSITTAYAYFASSPTVGGGSIGNYIGYYAQPSAAGNNLAAGSASNINFQGIGSAATSAGGSVNNRTAMLTLPSGGSTAGTTSNLGLYITGNGGTAAGGTANNYALYSDSTAPMRITGTFITAGYLVGALPATAGTGATAGARAHVTNQLTSCPAVGAALTGGGGITCPVFYNGTAWVGG